MRFTSEYEEKAKKRAKKPTVPVCLHSRFCIRKAINRVLILLFFYLINDLRRWHGQERVDYLSKTSCSGASGRTSAFFVTNLRRDPSQSSHCSKARVMCWHLGLLELIFWYCYRSGRIWRVLWFPFGDWYLACNLFRAQRDVPFRMYT